MILVEVCWMKGRFRFRRVIPAKIFILECDVISVALDNTCVNLGAQGSCLCLAARPA